MKKDLKQKREEYFNSAKTIDECLSLFSNITHGCYDDITEEDIESFGKCF